MSLSKTELEDLRYARNLLENPGFASRATNLLGIPIEKGFEALPKGASKAVGFATEKALQTALQVALVTLGSRPQAESSEVAHKFMASATGAVGGAFGMAALTVELPVSTTLMLRSIADIARSEGERIKSPESRLACMQVFALGGRVPGAKDAPEDATESAYFAVRLAMARATVEAAEYIATHHTISRGAPVLVRFLSQISSRFGVVVSQKAAAQAVPLLGAVGGALVNTVFIDHFQNMARGHFIVRRLERTHDAETVQTAYLEL